MKQRLILEEFLTGIVVILLTRKKKKMLTRIILINGGRLDNIYGVTRSGTTVATIQAVYSFVKRNMVTAIRKERDTFGELQVPADRYYGAQTARLHTLLLSY